MTPQSFLGLTTDAWTAIGSIASAIAALAAAVGLFCTWHGLKQSSRSMQLQVLENVFRDIRELDREWFSEFETWDLNKKIAWSATFFNTVEYLCFIVNKKITNEDEALRIFFFDEGLPAWRKKFDEHVRCGFINDSQTLFPELKKAYRKLVSVE